MSDIASRLRQLRKKKGLSLRQLAKIAHISHSFIADIEAGRSRPSLDTLTALAKGLDVSPEELVGKAKDTKSETTGGSDLSPDLRRLVNSAKALSNRQIRALNDFLATIIGATESKEERVPYPPNLEELLPRNEPNLGRALAKISEIAYQYKLDEKQVSYLHEKAVDYYGRPFPSYESEAAHGPKVPGQVRRNKDKGDS